MGIVEIENIGKNVLERFPLIKRSVKRVYQVISYILYILTKTRAVYFEMIMFVAAAWSVRFFEGFYKSKYFKTIISLSMPILCVISILFSYFYNSYNSLHRFLNSLMSDRLSLGHIAIQKYGLPFFGSSVTWVTGRLGIERTETYFYVDSSYVQIALVYGLIVLMFIVLSFSIMCYRAHKEEKYLLCIALLFLAIHSVTEPQLFELNYNPLILLIATSFIKSYKLPIGHQIKS